MSDVCSSDLVVALGRCGLGESFFGQAGMALLLQAARFFLGAGRLIGSGDEAEMRSAHLPAPIVGTRGRLVPIGAVGEQRRVGDTRGEVPILVEIGRASCRERVCQYV